ncbi:MAG: orotidine-5'-phosphate decarboxylase [Tannerellaceae bacterium]|jgi:orotidine-5'-phosphate decarboxylase|nr:orotidine-5'-phosphate decarboxylase [Tannerellaceae bacterium]
MTKQQLTDNIRRRRSFLCIGLDTDTAKIPAHLLHLDDPIFAFNRAVIDATAPFCIAYKPNLAFYESHGSAGIASLEKSIAYIKNNHPDHFVIADAKRGDIGNTAEMYARAFFERMSCDAVTIAPYMGSDSLRPFTAYPGKWVILLALTSNRGASDFQLQATAGGERLFEAVIRTSMQWASDDALMFVAGATRPDLLRDIRKIAPHNFLLVPGIGAQGGDLRQVVEYGICRDCCGLIVNASRSVIYADAGPRFAEAAAEAAAELQAEMDGYLKKYNL